MSTDNQSAQNPWAAFDKWRQGYVEHYGEQPTPAEAWLAALAQAPAPSGELVPPILFDSFAVSQALSTQARERTNILSVGDVLDAVVGLLRAPKGAPK